MGRKCVLTTLTVIVGLGLLYASQTFSQQRGRGGGPGRGGRMGRFDPERMRERMMDRLREYLGAGEQEWSVLRPRVEKVASLSRQKGAGGGRMGMVMLMMRRRPGSSRGESRDDDRRFGGFGPPGRERGEIEKAALALREVVQTGDSSSEQIREKLTALRRARENVKQQLDTARDELRELLTPRQEAKLVLLGIMD